MLWGASDTALAFVANLRIAVITANAVVFQEVARFHIEEAAGFGCELYLDHILRNGVR